MWFVAGNRFIQLSNGLGEFGVLDEVGWLIFESWSWEWTVYNILKGGGMNGWGWGSKKN